MMPPSKAPLPPPQKGVIADKKIKVMSISKGSTSCNTAILLSVPQ